MFERLFDHIFAQCMARDQVAGDTQVVDSAPVKAAASLDSLREKQASVAPSLTVAGEPATPAPAAAVRSAPAHQLRREAARRAKQQTGSRWTGRTAPQSPVTE